MAVTIRYGQSEAVLDAINLSHGDRECAPGNILAEALPATILAALDQPHQYPALRQAITPDDHIAIIVDADWIWTSKLITPLLDYLVGVGIDLAQVTVVYASPTTGEESPFVLPDAYHAVRIEKHDPADRDRLRYLATTKKEKRVYLNRTVVDAEQVIVLSRRMFDPQMGYSGGESLFFPNLTEAQSAEEDPREFHRKPPGEKVWPLRKVANEVSWLLGAPFHVQCIEGFGDCIGEVICGAKDACDEGLRRLNAAWRVRVNERPDVVLATLTGDPAGHTFLDIARAAACASRVVSKDGKIILMTEAAPKASSAMEAFKEQQPPKRILKYLSQAPRDEGMAMFFWAHALLSARLYVLSGWDVETVEELQAQALQKPSEVQRLLSDSQNVLYLPDAHKTLAVLETEEDDDDA